MPLRFFTASSLLPGNPVPAYHMTKATSNRLTRLSIAAIDFFFSPYYIQ